MNDSLQGVLLLVGGIAPLAMSLYKLNRTGFKRKTIEDAEGVVFDIQNMMRHSNAQTTRLIIRFVTKENLWVTNELEDSFIPGIFKKGEKIKVRYDRENPEDFYIVSFKVDAHYYIFILLGMFLIVFGIFTLLYGSFL